MNTNSKRTRFVQYVLSLGVILLSCVNANGQAWHDYSPPPNYFDWQLFAPVGEHDVERSPRGEGYFGSVERMNMWLLRPNQASIGNLAGAAPTPAFLPSHIDYLFVVPNPGSPAVVPVTSTSFLLPIVGGGSFGFQLNSIDDALPQTSDGNGNRIEFGWVDEGVGWMVGIENGNMTQDRVYGVDDKRIDQVPSIQGVPGSEGSPAVIDENGVMLVAAVAPTAPVPGFQSIPAIQGLTSVHVNFADPLGLLLGFTDTNSDLLPDDLNGDGVITAGAFPGGDQFRIGVVFDRLSVNNRMDQNSVEVMTIRRKKQLQGGANAEAYLGMRFLEMDDRFQLNGLGGVLSDMVLNNNALNRIIGPQFGFRISKKTNRWSTAVQAKFMAGANFASIRQTGVIGDHLSAGSGIAGTPLAGFPNTFGGADLQHRLLTERFSPVGEFSFDAGYQITSQLKLKTRWTGMVAGGIGRAANTVLYQIPTLGIINRSEDLFAHSISIGVEMNR